jgi:predicted RecA/RadA family phage recombinase
MTIKGVQPGKILSITAGGAVASGSVQQVGSEFIGVALDAASASGVVYPLATEGVFTINKKTSETWAIGDSLYWDSSASTASKTYVAGAADNFVGVATAVAAAAATSGNCKLREGASPLGALVGQLSGTQLANTADDAAVGGIPVVHMIDIPATAGDTDVTLTHKTRFFRFDCVKTDEAGLAGGTLTVKNGSTAITDAIAWDNTVSDKDVSQAGTLDDAQWAVAAGGTLKVTTSHNQSRGYVIAYGLRVA